jgi:hypothetical protein
VPGYRLDAAALLPLLVKNLTQLSDLDIEIALFDYPPVPDRLHDLVFGNKLSMPLEQESEQGEPAPAQRERRGGTSLVQSEQTAAAAAIEAEPVEQ